MLYNIDGLATAAREAIEADRNEWLGKQASAVTQLRRETEEWATVWGSSWKVAASRITRAIRDGKPVTREMLPSDERNIGLAFFHPSHDARPSTKPYRPPVELSNLISILATLSGDTVNTNGLRELGISRETMRRCVQYMAAGTIK